MVKGKAGEKALDLAYFIDDEAPRTLHGDVTRLRQIVVNLLSNAVKFTAEGEVVLTVAAERTGTAPEDSNAYECGSPQGYRVGIPPERMDRLFQSFTRSTSRRRVVSAAPPGLAISKRLAELMAERSVESTGVPARGRPSRFTIAARGTAESIRRMDRAHDGFCATSAAHRRRQRDQSRMLVLQTRAGACTRSRPLRAPRPSSCWVAPSPSRGALSI